MNVLVVDDSKLARLTLIKSLHNVFNDLNIGEAENGEVALLLIKQIIPEMVFLDLTMPVMNGYELLEILNKQFPSIQVIIVTADIQKGSKERIDKLGAKGYIQKPITDIKLKEVLTPIIESQAHE